MITTVSTWRCKCGARIKVVGETDKDRHPAPAAELAVCPECGDQQAIYAHRIIEVTCEKGETADNPNA